MFKRFEDIKVGDKFVCLADNWSEFTKGKEYTIIEYEEENNYERSRFGVLDDCNTLNYIYSWDVRLMDFPNKELEKAIELLKLNGYHVARSNITKGE